MGEQVDAFLEFVICETILHAFGPGVWVLQIQKIMTGQAYLITENEQFTIGKNWTQTDRGGTDILFNFNNGSQTKKGILEEVLFKTLMAIISKCSQFPLLPA